MTNEQLKLALESKLRPGAPYTEQDLTAFALGAEWATKYEREQCAQVAEAAAKKMGDIGRQHRDEGRTDSMDRCYSRSLQCTQVAADIRTRSNVEVRGCGAGTEK